MIPGPIYIHQCPYCIKLISRYSLLSGNSNGVKVYSDGKSIKPMAPEFPIITKCANCKNIFWIKDAKPIGSYDYEDNIFGDSFEENTKNEWKEAESASTLSVYDLISVLGTEITKTKDLEIYIRERIWLGFNDRVRDNKILFTSEKDKILYTENIKNYIPLLDSNNINDIFKIAELYRNIGNYKKCKELLNEIKDDDVNWIKEYFLKKCEIENSNVFEITN